MNSLETRRCFNHAKREAAARCLDCGRFFCRECVTEHDDRVLCAACIAGQSAGAAGTGRDFRNLKALFFLVFGFALLFLVFYYTGAALTKIPAEFHKGGLW